MQGIQHDEHSRLMIIEFVEAAVQVRFEREGFH
jgi:hypothetical protein